MLSRQERDRAAAEARAWLNERLAVLVPGEPPAETTDSPSSRRAAGKTSKTTGRGKRASQGRERPSAAS